ncbi:MAG: hypothetical protein K2W94_03905 [Alphaproteobacteria bacterium]|nr:hypothetical protein [Alphaproteobacteria bacterium]
MKILKNLWLFLILLSSSITSAYEVNWTVLNMCVSVLDGNVWEGDGRPIARKMILDRLDFLEDGDRDNGRLAEYTSQKFTALAAEAKGLLTTSSRKNSLFNSFVDECESIHTEGDDKIKKSVHMVLEKIVEETKDKLKWWSKLDGLESKPAARGPSDARAISPSKGPAKKEFGADGSQTNGHTSP